VRVVEGTLIGAYRIQKQIGEGGMGSVWLAEHSMLGRRAAIKVLHHEFSTKPDVVTRFFNEARAATAIADPGIVQIFDFGHHTDGSAYIVMELLDGEALDVRVARQGALDLPQALRIMRQVASTLGAAHARGIVHRDLKPENIFIVKDPEVAGGERSKVLDFGIAKLSAEQGGSKTQTSAVMGTPTYMSPEQCRGAGHVDQRSDVYALGCVLYRLVCGRPPFDAEGVGELIVMHLCEQPVPPSTLRPGIPPEVEQVILRCLAKDPAHRFSSGSELAIALGALTGSSPQVPAPQASYAAASLPTTLSSAAGAVTSSPPAKRSRVVPIAALGVCVVGAAFAIVFVTSRGTNDSPNTTPAAAPTSSPTPAPTPTPPPAATAAAPASTPPAAPDPTAEVAGRMKTVLQRFVIWSHDHAGAACPDITALGADVADPWGHAFKLTCSDQPSDQMVGVISAGPDGAQGTADDIASWSLGRDVADVAHGTRWTAVASAPVPPVTPVANHSPAKKGSSSKSSGATKQTKSITGSTKAGGGVELDENGLPIAR
jgi:serine/threonine protein kinase